jgi:hypothetical protein
MHTSTIKVDRPLHPSLASNREPHVAFRHGDIESILSTLSKNVGSGFGGGVAGVLFGVAKAALNRGKGDRFTSLDIKRVYFVRLFACILVCVVY